MPIYTNSPPWATQPPCVSCVLLSFPDFEYFPRLSNIIQTAHSLNLPFLVVGDFNQDTNSAEYAYLEHLLTNFCFSQLVHKPTTVGLVSIMHILTTYDEIIVPIGRNIHNSNE